MSWKNKLGLAMLFAPVAAVLVLLIALDPGTVLVMLGLAAWVSTAIWLGTSR